MNRLDLIRQRAYEIWEQDGRPDGRDQEHWHQAEAEMMIEERKGLSRHHHRARELRNKPQIESLMSSAASLNSRP